LKLINFVLLLFCFRALIRNLAAKL
jgi:hypothetical protein